MLYLTLSKKLHVIAESNIRKQNIVVIDGQEKGKVSAINNLLRRDQIKNMTPDAEKKTVINITTFKNL
ncbi:hypothetical protein [Sphingobacterium sp. UME9]|uniref:hypothetical protein n=1 Tax=Sphingobacterium sp. UME9 TaxID=1862316 RepID=UPI0016027CB8|nr:hypothetical protein [Sphingobacterium sp. UME9]MBB1643637.1 hypothetical protein [Sphingobacterium sp. UME9]